jgi:hypothetical protein
MVSVRRSLGRWRRVAVGRRLGCLRRVAVRRRLRRVACWRRLGRLRRRGLLRGAGGDEKQENDGAEESHPAGLVDLDELGSSRAVGGNEQGE